MIARINIKDKGAESFRTVVIRDIKGMSERDTERLARVTEDIIKNEIKNSIKRDGSTGNLASGFFAESLNIPGVAGWGVGDIDRLNQYQKYWRHVNYGSEAIGANWRHWLPKGSFVNERWVESKDGFFMMPSKPIPPMNYIERTIAQMDTIIHRVLYGR